MSIVQPLMLSGREVWPLVEGGKGISATNAQSSGAWAGAGGVGHLLRRERRPDRRERRGGPARLPRARPARASRGADRPLDTGGDQPGRDAPTTPATAKGRIHMNVLWEMGGCERVLQGVARRRQGPDPRRHLRRRHAVPAGRDLRPLRRLLLPDRLFGARVQRAVEARLPQVLGLAGRRWSTRIPGGPAATTGCPTSRTRSGREPALPRVLEIRKLMRRCRPRPRADRHGRRRLASRATGRS